MKNVNIVCHIIGDKIRTCKVKDYSVLSGTWLPISAHLLKKKLLEIRLELIT